jgi:hypothetical protein
MNSKNKNIQVPSIRYGEAGWISQSALPRDQEQSHRLHEPTSMISSLDPINGHDVIGIKGHPSHIDGILTVYFESEDTRKAYLDTSFNHPVVRLPGATSVDDDRGG